MHMLVAVYVIGRAPHRLAKGIQLRSDFRAQQGSGQLAQVGAGDQAAQRIAGMAAASDEEKVSAVFY